MGDQRRDGTVDNSVGSQGPETTILQDLTSGTAGEKGKTLDPPGVHNLSFFFAGVHILSFPLHLRYRKVANE